MQSRNPRIYSAGESVRIRDIGKAGHVRTPQYVRNKVGLIDSYVGLFENPEERAYGRIGYEPIPLYRVRLKQNDLWPDYAGSDCDTLVLEIYDHWLEIVTSLKEPQ
jgi:nitrile hydratase subunit beta